MYNFNLIQHLKIITHNPKVAGSNPAPATIKKDTSSEVPFFFCFKGIEALCFFYKFTPIENPTTTHFYLKNGFFYKFFYKFFTNLCKNRLKSGCSIWCFFVLFCIFYISMSDFLICVFTFSIFNWLFISLFC